MSKNALQQVLDSINSGVKTAWNFTPPGAMVNSLRTASQTPQFQDLNQKFQSFLNSNPVQTAISAVPFTPQYTQRVQTGLQQIGQTPEYANLFDLISSRPSYPEQVKQTFMRPAQNLNNMFNLYDSQTKQILPKSPLRDPNFWKTPQTKEEWDILGQKMTKDIAPMVIAFSTGLKPVAGEKIGIEAARTYAAYLRGLKKYGIPETATTEQVGNAFEQAILKAEGNLPKVKNVLKDFKILNRIKPEQVINDIAGAVDWLKQKFIRPIQMGTPSQVQGGIKVSSPEPQSLTPDAKVAKLQEFRNKLVMQGLKAEDAGNIALRNKLRNQVIEIDKAIQRVSGQTKMNQAVKPMVPKTPPIVQPKNLLGETIPIPPVKPAQESMLGTIGTGSTTGEEVLKAMDRLREQKVAPITLSTPVTAALDQAQLEQQMGPSIVEQTKDVSKEPIKVYRGGLPFDSNKITDRGLSVSTSKETAQGYTTATGNNKFEGGELSKGKGVIQEFTLNKGSKILNFNDVPEDLKKIFYKDSLTQGKEIISEWGRKKGYDAVNFTGSGIDDEIRVFNNKILSPSLSQLPKEEGGLYDIPQVLIDAAKKAKSRDELMDMIGKDKTLYQAWDKQYNFGKGLGQLDVYDYVHKTFKPDVAKSPVNNTPAPQSILKEAQTQAAITDLENKIRDDLMYRDEVSANQATALRDSLIKEADTAGFKVEAKDIKALREEAAQQVDVQTQILHDAKLKVGAPVQAEVPKGLDVSGMALNPNVSQYAEKIRNAVISWEKLKREPDMAAMEKKFPGLDEVSQAIRDSSGRPDIEVNMQTLQDILNRFPKGTFKGILGPKGPRVKIETSVTNEVPSSAPLSLPSPQTEPKSLDGGAVAKELSSGGKSPQLPPTSEPPPPEQQPFQGKPQEVLDDYMKKVSVGEPDAPKTPVNNIERFYSALVEKFYPITKYSNPNLPPGLNPKFMVSRYYGITGIVEGKLFYKTFRLNNDGSVTYDGPGLSEIIRPFNNDLNDVRAMLTVARDLELAGRKIWGLDPGKAPQVVQALKIKLGETKYNQLFAITKQIYDWWDRAALKPLVEVGAISPELREELRTSGMFYVPMTRIVSELDRNGYVPKNTNVFQPSSVPIQRIKGSKASIVDPLESFIKNLYKITNFVESKRVVNSVVNLRNINEEFKKIIVEIPAKVFPVATVVHKAEVDPISMEIIKDLADKVGYDFKTKLKIGGKRLGYTDAIDKEIVRKFGSSTLTAIHELGHAIDDKFGLTRIFISGPKMTSAQINAYLKYFKDQVPPGRKEKLLAALDLNKKVQKELRDLADLRQVRKTYGRKAEEKIATLFAWAVHNPTQTQKVAPNAFKIFQEFLKVHPELAKIKDLNAPSLVQTVEVSPETVFAKSPFAPAKNTIMNIENGVRKFYQVPPDLYGAMQGMTERVGNFVRVMATPAAWLRAGVTLAPEFAVRNPVKDQFSAFIQAKFGYIPGLDFTKGLFSALRKDDVYWKWKGQGGDHSELVAMDRATSQKTLEDVRKKMSASSMAKNVVHPLKALQFLSSSGEMGTRIGVFKRALNQTNLVEAIYEARNATTDFSVRGSQMQALSLMIAFFNPQIQSTARLAKAFKDNPFKTWLRVIAGLVIPSAILYEINRKNPTYKQLPQWVKDYYWPIFYDESKAPLLIPKPFEPGILFGSGTERILDWIHQDDPEPFKGYLNSLGQALTPSFIPTIMTGFIESIANWNFFTNRSIVGYYDQGKPAELQYTNFTTETMKALGNLTSKSPAILENFFYRNFGTLGKYALSISDKLLEGLGVTNLPPKPSPQLADIPVIRAFVAREPIGSQSESVNRFYEEFQRITKVKQAIMEFLKEGKGEKAKQYMDANPDFVYASALSSVNGTLSELRKKRKMVYMSRDLTPDEKKSAIDEIDKIITTMADKALEPLGKSLNTRGVSVFPPAKPINKFVPSAGAAEEAFKPPVIDKNPVFQLPIRAPSATSVTGSQGVMMPKFKVPSQDEMAEEIATNKKPIIAPPVEPVSDYNSFAYQFDTYNGTIDDMNTRINSIRTDRNLDNATKIKYIQLYEKRIQETKALRAKLGLNSQDYFNQYLTTDAGKKWYKAEIKAINAANGMGSIKAGATKIKALPKFRVGKLRISTKKITAPKLKLKPIKVPKFSATLKSKSAMSIPKLKLLKIKIPTNLKRLLK